MIKRVLIITDVVLVIVLFVSFILINYKKDFINTGVLQINYKDSIVITVGDKVDLLSNFEIVGEDIDEYEVKIDGDYSFDIVGDYSLEYVVFKDDEILAEKKLLLHVIENNNIKEEVVIENSILDDKNNNYIVNEIEPTYIDGILIVNKTYPLPKDFGNGLTIDTLDAFNKMKNDALNSSINLEIISGYRSYYSQQHIYNNYVKRDGVLAADTYSARAGHSEHQSGLAIDINSLDTSFANTNEGIWLNNNAYKYGFILRYPYGKDNVTGYMYEPWHFRYVGVDLATTLYNGGNWITLEEYFGITSCYN